MPRWTSAHTEQLELAAGAGWGLEVGEGWTMRQESTERTELVAWGLASWDAGTRWDERAEVESFGPGRVRVTLAGEALLAALRERTSENMKHES